MNKICFNVCALLLWLSLQASFCALGQAPDYARKRVVDSFLDAWLVRKDIPSTLQLFDRKALSDQSVFDCGCCNTTLDSKKEGQNPEAISRALSDFLKESNHHIKGSTLNDILFLRSEDHPKQSERLAATIKKYVLNQPECDKYYLVSYDALKSEKALKHFRNRYSLKGTFFTVIQYRVLNEDERYGDDTVLFVLWAKDKGELRVISVWVECY